MDKREYDRRYYRNLSDEKKIKFRLQIKKRRDKIRQWFVEYKKDLQCDECKENHPACLQFHHRKGTKKEFLISDGATKGFSIKKLLNEIAKCRILCANCHLKLHDRRRKRASKTSKPT